MLIAPLSSHPLRTATHNFDDAVRSSPQYESRGHAYVRFRVPIVTGVARVNFWGSRCLSYAEKAVTPSNTRVTCSFVIDGQTGSRAIVRENEALRVHGVGVRPIFSPAGLESRGT